MGRGDRACSLWQRDRSAVLQMARVPYLHASLSLGVVACVSLIYFWPLVGVWL